MPRPLFLLPLALSSILLAGNAAGQQPPPQAAPPAAPPPGYFPPPGYAPPPYGQPYGPYAMPLPPIPLPRTRFYSPAMMASGIVLSTLGSIAGALGTAAYVSNDNFNCGFTGACMSHGADTVTMVVGGIAMLGAIPLLAFGSRRVQTKLEKAALTPSFAVSPGGASLTFTF